jgi:3-deoxy-manno-octulosonate cytidylyltransferase (CMP-KDO synthetase)
MFSLKPAFWSGQIMPKTLVLIPARMASTRLPGKPLADIAGKPMILHVLDRANEAGIGVPFVCTDSQEIADCVTAAGGNAVMTRADHPSGSDRIWEAVSRIDPDKKARFIVNVQGDLPTIDPEMIVASLKPLEEGPADIATLATRITDGNERTNPNVVKAVGTPIGENRMRALYFTRATAPWSPPGEEAPLYHHIGLYAYRREALEKFVSLPPSPLELQEKLEQLRALENGMRIDIAVVDTAPLGVDTPDDLEKARKLLAAKA